MNGAANLASVMEQSLNPRKPERSNGGHYPEKAAVVEAYKRTVSYIMLASSTNLLSEAHHHYFQRRPRHLSASSFISRRHIDWVLQAGLPENQL